MKYLVTKRGADMLTEDVGGFTPLLNAVWRDDPHVVRFFLAQPRCTLEHLMVRVRVGGRRGRGSGAVVCGCGYGWEEGKGVWWV
jgi:hypothetical protein